MKKRIIILSLLSLSLFVLENHPTKTTFAKLTNEENNKKQNFCTTILKRKPYEFKVEKQIEKKIAQLRAKRDIFDQKEIKLQTEIEKQIRTKEQDLFNLAQTEQQRIAGQEFIRKIREITMQYQIAKMSIKREFREKTDTLIQAKYQNINISKEAFNLYLNARSDCEETNEDETTIQKKYQSDLANLRAKQQALKNEDQPWLKEWEALKEQRKTKLLQIRQTLKQQILQAREEFKNLAKPIN